MRFSGRPESNVADRFVDTGNFAGEHADELLVELLWSAPAVLAARPSASKRTSMRRRAATRASPATTGRRRRSSPARAAPTSAPAATPQPRPTRRWGALELALRYSHLDLTDGTLDSGELDKWSYNLSWWASAQWKIGLTYGDADLDRGGLTGDTKIWLARFQWLY